MYIPSVQLPIHYEIDCIMYILPHPMMGATQSPYVMRKSTVDALVSRMMLAVGRIERYAAFSTIRQLNVNLATLEETRWSR